MADCDHPGKTSIALSSLQNYRYSLRSAVPGVPGGRHEFIGACFLSTGGRSIFEMWLVAVKAGLLSGEKAEIYFGELYVRLFGW